MSSSKLGSFTYLEDMYRTGAEEAGPQGPRTRDHGCSTKLLTISLAPKTSYAPNTIFSLTFCFVLLSVMG